MVEVLFKVLFASSVILLLYLPIILLLIMWNNETPTPLTNKGKNGVGKWWEDTHALSFIIKIVKPLALPYSET